MIIEKKHIDELLPAEYNPRISLKDENPEEFEKLKKSIETFGIVDPVIWNKRTGYVVGGHQRLSVLKELGYEEIDVSVVDLDDAKEKALNIALNKISGEWDEPKLKDLLEELQLTDIDETLTGFSNDEIEGLMEEIDLDDFFEQITEVEDQIENDENEEEKEKEDRLVISEDLLERAHDLLKLEVANYNETELYKAIEFHFKGE